MVSSRVGPPKSTSTAEKMVIVDVTDDVDRIRGSRVLEQLKLEDGCSSNVKFKDTNHDAAVSTIFW
jgi:hypothetical protein